MNILFLGNGFDLYHNLKTSYNDFYKVLNYPEAFRKECEDYINNKSTDNLKYSEYFKDLKDIDINAVNKMTNILAKNGWAKYYRTRHEKIEGWIDFENEMTPVFKFFQKIFQTNFKVEEHNFYIYVSDDGVDLLSTEDYAMADIWDTIFVRNSDSEKYIMQTPFYDARYGVNKSAIISYLEKELDAFITSFTIYLNQFVAPKDIVSYNWITSIKPDRIITFNYTKTEERYFKNLISNNISHIHGSVSSGNFVFGNDLIEDNDVDFLNFSKRFQRLTKVEDFSYVDFLKHAQSEKNHSGVENVLHPKEKPDFKHTNVYFIGCSLDKNDSPIFKNYIEKADSRTIFCYGFNDYKKAIANLINIFGSEKIEQWKHDNKLNFKDIKGLASNEQPQEINPQKYYEEQYSAYLNSDSLEF